MIQNQKLGLITDNIRIPIMMFFASFIAGSTAEGGGAVAFPIMTLFFKITPHISRDFSLLIQSFGMSFASFFIFLNRIKILNNIVFLACAGGFIGIITGFYFLEGVVPAAYLKMFFTCFWLTFALSIFKNRERIFKQQAQDIVLSHNSIFIFLVSILGGLVSSQLGSGIDIILFSLLTIAFRVDLKVAIPTSVVIMSLTSFFGSLFKIVFLSIEPQAIDYTLCSIPIVIIGAPLGAFIIHESSRKLALTLLSFSIIAQFIASLLIIEQTKNLVLFNIVSIIFGLSLFFSLDLYRSRKARN